MSKHAERPREPTDCPTGRGSHATPGPGPEDRCTTRPVVWYEYELNISLSFLFFIVLKIFFDLVKSNNFVWFFYQELFLLKER